MVRDFNIDIDVVGCLIIREEDGLVKSFRNIYLSLEERFLVIILNKFLILVKEVLNNGERDSLKIIEIISKNINICNLVKIDYVEVVDFLLL